MILLQYAKEHRFPTPTFFVDDGYCGTNYDRPGFQAMLAEIEAGRVAVCCTKDLSRLWRNSSLTGLYINFTFPKYNVRYIAINDYFDTIDHNSTDSDIAGIKTPSPETADPYHWNTNTVVHILERREYTGCTVNFKTYTNSIWDKKQRETPIEKQAGCITDEKFSMMSKTYEDEQTQLKVEIQTLQQEIEVQERQIENLEQFIQRVRKYEDLDELTPYALRELVKAIYIEAPDKSSGKRHQGIRISYDLVGFIPVEELLKQETA